MPETTVPEAPPPRERRPGDTLDGRFRLEATLGRGGFGEVWRASELLPDGSTVRQVALKLLSPDRGGGDWTHEAKVLASLRHRALVTVYSAGLVHAPGPTPFVAMELLAGTTLAGLLVERGAVGWRRGLSWVRSVAEALDAIHAQGIVHLDLKPANLLLDDEGSLRVVDFGIARRGESALPPTMPEGAGGQDALSTGALVEMHAGAGQTSLVAPRGARLIAGTPGFMAPEVIEGRGATPAADAYALGACLYQMLTGELPQKTRAAARHASSEAEVAAWRVEMRAATVAGDLVPLAARAPGVPRAVADLVARLLALDPAARPAPGTLAAELVNAWEHPYGISDHPYLGLRAYGGEGEGALFGRDDDAGRLAAELARRPLLVLQGASGAGKSSLAVAGVVPALARSFVDGCDDWVAAVVRPGQDIDAAVRKARRPRAGVVLVVDQLEELVTQLTPEAQALFLLTLRRYLAPTADAAGEVPARGVRVLCTLREDFTTRVCSLDPLGPALQAALRFVPPPSAASAHAIVTGPARLAGVAIDDERPVVDEVLRELRSGEGRLPLVSFALAEWWPTRQSGVLTAAAWQHIGGVAGALSRHADRTLHALPPPAQDAARTLCLRLVTAEGTRARVPVEILRAMGPEHALALDAFERARLVAIDDAGSTSISHEALMSAWATLSTWLDEERADRAHLASLAALAGLWRAESSPRHRDELVLRAARLSRAEDLAARRPDLPGEIAEFIAASRRRQRRDVWLRRAWGAVLLAAAAVAGAAYVAQVHASDVTIRGREREVDAFIAQRDKAIAVGKELGRQRDAAFVAVASASAAAAQSKEALARVEEQHRQELAKRYAADSFENKVVSFLLLWEHAWNLHDVDRIGSFFAPELTWFDFHGTRDELVASLEGQWAKSPASRVLISELAVTRDKSGRTTVRMTRDERLFGKSIITVGEVVLHGSDLGDFQIESGVVERTISNGKPLGCPP